MKRKRGASGRRVFSKKHCARQPTQRFRPLRYEPLEARWLLAVGPVAPPVLPLFITGQVHLDSDRTRTGSDFNYQL
jgi:hypothetical protein